MSCGFHCRLQGRDFAAARARVAVALLADSFGVLTQTDMQQIAPSNG
ncbi:MAG: hypothetical protein KIT17_25380 [Rubrivivax sp.]|nr:hypothetical protein [Rubrivivax sp.]